VQALYTAAVANVLLVCSFLSDIFLSLQVEFKYVKNACSVPIYRHPQYNDTKCGEQRAMKCRGLTVL